MPEKKKIHDPDKMIREVLTEDPGYKLPDNFALMMAEKMANRFAWALYIREFLLYVAVLAGIIAVYAGMALLWFDVDWLKWWNFMVDHAAFIAGLNLLFLFILFADRVLLRYFMFRISPGTD